VHEEIQPNVFDEVDSYSTSSIGLQDDLYKEYQQSSIDNSPPVHLCSKIGEDEKHIIFIDGGGQEVLSEEPTVVNRHDEHDHEGEHDRHSVQDEPFPESMLKAKVEVVIVRHLVQRRTKTFRRAPKLPIEDFQGNITHFKTDLMMLKERF
jgi:hypothetical protein